ncbi:MAG: hypothetical protein K0S74_1468 [Chlamydiales bacterium]|jgi:flagellar hook protein FlgE|nr:hypothetical protein [Chlamydiales bacterium]
MVNKMNSLIKPYPNFAHASIGYLSQDPLDHTQKVSKGLEINLIPTGKNSISYVTDKLGNRILGKSFDPQTNEQIFEESPFAMVSGKKLTGEATTKLKCRGNLPCFKPQKIANIQTQMWKIFSRGENFGVMKCALINEYASQDFYGSGYYHDSQLIQATGTLIGTTIRLLAGDADLGSPVGYSAFRAGDTVQVTEGRTLSKRIISVAAGVLTLNDAIGFTGGGSLVTVINLTAGSTSRGMNQNSTSITTGAGLYDDVLHSQIAMVDQYGRLLASFYRVASSTPKRYRHVSAVTNAIGNPFIRIGMGEFCRTDDLRGLIESTLQDRSLTFADPTTQITHIQLDKFGCLKIGGTGLVHNFSLVVNQDNFEMRNRLGSLAFNGIAAQTQAIIDLDGCVPDSRQFNIVLNAARAISETISWFDTPMLQDYGYSSVNPATEYGEYAGLNLYLKDSSDDAGILKLSLINAQGMRKERDFYCVAQNPNFKNYEFSTLGQLASLIDSTLKETSFSSLLDKAGNLKSDTSALSCIEDGKLFVSTLHGSFNNLHLTPSQRNTISKKRSDYINFGTVLGELLHGVSGKQGVSIQMIEPDFYVTSTNKVCDANGALYNLTIACVQDYAKGLDNVEWKIFPMLDIEEPLMTNSNAINRDAITRIFNHINQGIPTVLGIDPTDYSPYAPGYDIRYSTEVTLTINSSLNLPTKQSGIASLKLPQIVMIDLSYITSFRGRLDIGMEKINGTQAGELINVILDPKHSDSVLGYYSNGEVKRLAKLKQVSILL